MGVKLSIVVPIYNVENYLDQCLTSILNQHFKDYEVILINDGSLDRSLEIANTFCQKDDRFKVYTKENGGLSSARNYGFQYVSGTYLTFLDSDDYLELDTYALMMKKIEEENLDIVMSDVAYFFEDGAPGYVLAGLNESFDAIKSKQALLSPMFAWNKIYRSEYFFSMNKQYPLGLWFEDIPVTSKCFTHTEKIGYVNHIGYHYRQRSSSIMGQRSDKMADIFIILKMIVESFQEEGIYDKYYEELEYLFCEHIMLYGQFRFLVSDHYRALYAQSVSFMNQYFKNYKRNKYIQHLGVKNRLFIHTLNQQTMVLYRKYLKRNEDEN